jgi:hypothetical protein
MKLSRQHRGLRLSFRNGPFMSSLGSSPPGVCQLLRRRYRRRLAGRVLGWNRSTGGWAEQRRHLSEHCDEASAQTVWVVRLLMCA